MQGLDLPWQDVAALPAAGAAAAPSPAAGLAGGQGAAPPGALPSAEHLLAVYASLQQQHGFQAQQVEAALSALPLAAVGVEAALDWLLLHLEAAQLPRRYSSQARTGGGGSVDVKHKARDPTPAEAQAQAQAAAQAAAAAAAAAQAELELRRREDAQRAAELERAAAEQRAAEEQQRRSWIMQYMEVRRRY